jgi:hypothetical protein
MKNTAQSFPMMTSARRPLLFALLLCTAPPGAGAVLAQDAAAAAGRGPVLLRLPAGTQALGMGNAFALGSTNSDAIFYNSAFAERLRGASAAVQWFGSGATFYSMSAGMEWWRGALAVGVRALDHGMPPAAGARQASPGEGTLPDAGEHVAERAATVAYARSVRGVRVGLAGHLLEQRHDAESSVSPAADVSLGMVLGFVATGLSARNIGPSYRLAGTDVKLPLTFTLAAAATAAPPVGPLDVLPVLYVAYEAAGDIVPGAGVELSYWPVPGRTFSLRLGARRAPAGVRPFTAGAGFTGDRVILDYALVPYTGGPVSHRLGVRWR